MNNKNQGHQVINPPRHPGLIAHAHTAVKLARAIECIDNIKEPSSNGDAIERRLSIERLRAKKKSPAYDPNRHIGLLIRITISQQGHVRAKKW